MTKATATPISTINNLRPVLSLLPVEALIAFVVGGSAWLSLHHFTREPVVLSLWAPFLFCNTLAISAICAYRLLWRVESPKISRFGYGTFAHPLVQMVAALLYQVMANRLAINQFTLLLMLTFVGSFGVQFVTSGLATARGFSNKDCRGEIAAFPLFIAWCLLLEYLHLLPQSAF